MQILFLSLENFKKFKSKKLDFISGLNIIKGPNEQGKSTLLAGFLAALFLDPKSRSQKGILNLKSWGGEELFKTRINFRSNKKEYILYKDFEKGALSLEGKTEKNMWLVETEDFKKAAKILEEEIGLPTLPLFKGTACIHQDGISQIHTGQKELEKAVQRLLTSGAEEESVVEVVKKLDEAISSLEKGLKGTAVKYPGKIKKLESKIENLREKYSEVASWIMESRRLKTQKKESEKELLGLEKELEVADRQIKDNKKLKEIEENLFRFKKEHKESFEKLEKAEELDSALLSLKETLEPYKAFLDEEFKEKISRILALDKIVKERKEKFESREEQLTKKWSLTKIGFLGGAFLVSLGFILSLTNLYLFLGFLLLGILVAVSFFIIDKKKLFRSRELENLELEILRDEGEIKDGLEEIGLEEVSQLKSEVEEFNKILNRKNSLEAELKGVLGGKTKEDLAKETKELSRQIAIEEEKETKELKLARLTANEFQELLVRKEKLEEERKILEKKISEAKIRLETTKVDSEDKIRLEEKIEEAEEDLEFARRRLKVLKLTKEVLIRAKNKVVSQSRDALEGKIKEVLPIVTNGRYDKVNVDEDLNFKVYSKEKEGEVVPEEELSRGTVDQFYLAVRFALIRFLFKNTYPPVFLDDPFITFDKKREKKAMELLKDFSKDYQCFYFTCRDDYDEWGDKIVKL